MVEADDELTMGAGGFTFTRDGKPVGQFKFANGVSGWMNYGTKPPKPAHAQ